MARWLCVSTHTNAEVVKKHLVWGARNSYKHKIDKVQVGDTLLIYTMREKINSKIYHPAIVDIYEVLSKAYEDLSPIFEEPKLLQNEIFPIRLKVKPLPGIAKRIPFIPLIGRLSFIKNRTKWTDNIQGAMHEIPEEDFELIMREAEKQK